MSLDAKNSELNILGIETSCDETAAAIVARTSEGGGRVRANVVRSQLDEHRAYGGVVPEIAARAHVELLDEVIRLAMSQAKTGWGELDGIAVAAGPGLIGGIMVGTTTAKAIALVHDLPLLAVNHLEGHALTVGLTDGLRPPYLLLLVSGGHTQLLIVEDVASYKRLGTTIDDALGEAFDKTAKLLGLPYPGGPQVEHHARRGDPNRFALPRPLVGREEPHFSYAGLKTALRRTAQELAPLADGDIADLCASFQAAVGDTLEDRCARAMAIYAQTRPADAPKNLVVAGGVAANAYLRTRLEATAAAHAFRLVAPPPALCTDNAAMIAWAGAERLARGLTDDLGAPIRARWPLDQTAPPAIGAGVKA